MAGSTQDKTEQATPKRIAEARRKGQVAKSIDLTGALCLLAIIILLYIIKDSFFVDLQRYMTRYFSEVAHVYASGKTPLLVLNEAAVYTLKLLAPFFVVALLMVMAASLLQVGFMFSPEALKPKGMTLNPMSGLEKMFSTKSLMELLKSVLKFAIIGYVTYHLIKVNMNELLMVFNCSPGGIYQVIMGFVLKVALWGALAYMGLALLDYMYQRYDFDKSMKMSKQEVKDEHKQTEGDPMIKSRQREIRRQIALNKIMSEVPRATVVVTNPSHLAVALRYDQEEMSAPRVVAKGAGWLAAQIREIARENGVPVLENKEVARFIYKSVEIGQEIPLDIYQAVAQILAMVYRLKAKKRYGT